MFKGIVKKTNTEGQKPTKSTKVLPTTDTKRANLYP